MRKIQKIKIVLLICLMAICCAACQDTNGDVEALTLKEDASTAQYLYQKDGTEIIEVSIVYDDSQNESDVIIDLLIATESKDGNYDGIQIIKKKSNFENGNLQASPLEKSEVIQVMITHEGDIEDIFAIEKDGDGLLTVKRIE